MNFDLIKQENQNRQKIIEIYEKAASQHPEKIIIIKDFFAQASSFGVTLSSNHQRASANEAVQKIQLLFSLLPLSSDDKELVDSLIFNNGFWEYVSEQTGSRLCSDTMALLDHLEPPQPLYQPRHPLMLDLIKQENQSRQNVIDIYEKAAYDRPEKVDAIKSFFTQARSFGVILSSNHRRLLSEIDCLEKVRLLFSMVLLSSDDSALVANVVGRQGFWGYLSTQKNSRLYNDVMTLMSNIQPASSPANY